MSRTNRQTATLFRQLRVRVEKASLDGFGQTFACSHPGGWAGKAVESPNQETAKDGQAAKKDSLGHLSGGKGCGVEKNDFLDALRPVSEGGQANGSPIMNDELDTLDFKVIQQVDDVLGMSSEVITVFGEGRFVRKSASDVVGGNATGFEVGTEESDCDKNRTKWDFREEREWGLGRPPLRPNSAWTGRPWF